jgi:hypothetical protein
VPSPGGLACTPKALQGEKNVICKLPANLKLIKDISANRRKKQSKFASAFGREKKQSNLLRPAAETIKKVVGRY